MKWLRIISFLTLAGSLATADDGAGRDRASSTEAALPEAISLPAPARVSVRAPAPAARLPFVLRNMEPVESRVLTLPGSAAQKRVPAPPPVNALVPSGWRPKGVPALPLAPDVTMANPAAMAGATLAIASVVPAAPMFPIAVPHLPLGPVAPAPSAGEADTLAAGTVPASTPVPTDPKAAPLESPKFRYPAGFAQESAVFVQRELGHWTLADARALLGEPLRQRAAIDDDSTESGHIFAFHDPTRRYRELELDFDKEKGLLRTVFIYPWNLSWQECRKLWGANVSATEGNRGRVFYSYVNRRLDVLVDHDGKVISLGLY